jgi:PPK2 family polyphosphate:nucleotide phosphotransferase
MDINKLNQWLRVKQDEKIDLDKIDTGFESAEEFKVFKKSELKDKARKLLDKNTQDLAEMQELLYASDTYSVLLIFQGMDASGKDGTIKHVMSGVNPQGCQVFSFKQPSAEELDHDFLWRCAKRMPERGRIGIFNRSYYEEVLVVKVHPEILDKQQLPPGPRDKSFWQKRYDAIIAYEQHLANSGTLILKFFLHISKKEQKQRFLERLENREKYWKFSPFDMAERQYWNNYKHAFEEALSATSTKHAPWFIIPADYKWVARTLVADIVVQSIKALDLKYPEVSPEKVKSLMEARKKLEEE